MSSSPNWPLNYVPTPEEWAATWAGKADVGDVAAEAAARVAGDTALASTATFNAAFVTWIASLPTALPVTAGLPWLNGGVLQVS